MKAVYYSKIYNALTVKEKKAVKADLKNFIIGALAQFYEEGQVGDNPLVIVIPIPFENGKITGIEMMFTNPGVEMVYHMKVKGKRKPITSPLTHLEVETLFSIMKAFEQQGFVLNEEFVWK